MVSAVSILCMMFGLFACLVDCVARLAFVLCVWFELLLLVFLAGACLCCGLFSLCWWLGGLFWWVWWRLVLV